MTPGAGHPAGARRPVTASRFRCSGAGVEAAGEGKRQALAAAVRWDQRHGERAARDAQHGEADAAHHACGHDQRHVRRGGQGQRGQPEREQASREDEPTAVPTISRGVTRYVATLERVSAVVVRPAVPVLAPADLAYSGTAESSR
jgi:hypothetical protein